MILRIDVSAFVIMRRGIIAAVCTGGLLLDASTPIKSAATFSASVLTSPQVVQSLEQTSHGRSTCAARTALEPVMN
jgi:hypothetical protein